MKNREEAEVEVVRAMELLRSASKKMEGDFKGEGMLAKHLIWDANSILLTVRQMLIAHMPVDSQIERLEKKYEYAV